MNVINSTLRQVTTCLFHRHSLAPHLKSPMNPPFHLVSRRVLFGLAALSAVLVFTSQVSAADPGKIVVQVDKPGAKISPTFYGLMTEEINYSYDGGLYGELIQNRIFKNAPRGGRGGREGGGPRATNTAPAVPAPVAIPHWSVLNSEGAKGVVSLDTNDPINTVALTTSLKLDITSVGRRQRVGVANDGYWGIPVRPNTTYRASFFAKASKGFSWPLTVNIESNDGQTTFASATLSGVKNKWQKYTVTLKTGDVPAHRRRALRHFRRFQGHAELQPRVSVPADLQGSPQWRPHGYQPTSGRHEADLPALPWRQLC